MLLSDWSKEILEILVGNLGQKFLYFRGVFHILYKEFALKSVLSALSYALPNSNINFKNQLNQIKNRFFGPDKIAISIFFGPLKLYMIQGATSQLYDMFVLKGY